MDTVTWSYDPADPDITEPYTVLAEQVWWTTDLSGRRQTTPVAQTDPGTPIGPTDQQDYPPGQFPAPILNPPTDPADLAGQLTAPHLSRAPAADLFKAIRDLYRYQVLGPAQRAAVLDILADTDHVLLDGAAQDRLQRPGVAISTEVTGIDGITRHRLIFDTVTGMLLSYEQITPAEPIEASRVVAGAVYRTANYTTDPG